MTEQILQKINQILKKADFETLSLENFASEKNKFCFDLLVKKNNLFFSVKVFPNIDNLNPDIIKDLKSLSILLKSKPILIGIRNRYNRLEENTIYIREDLPFISLHTLENIFNNQKYPYILAKRGGGVIFLDGDLMKTLREKLSISRKDLSDKLEVTKRTICAYETENMRPSEKIANKICEILQSNEIFKKINVFEWNIKFDFNQEEVPREEELNEFESHIQSIINDIGISAYWYKKGPIPFKLSLYSRKPSNTLDSDFYPLFSGLSEEQKKINELNLKCLRTFTNIFHKNSLFIINNNVKISESLKKRSIPIVKIKDLEKIDDEDEFIEFIQESQK
ncbi:MAG: helix-turn-helix domain-containing protein [Candidatus Hodarchaeota archaeon]